MHDFKVNADPCARGEPVVGVPQRHLVLVDGDDGFFELVERAEHAGARVTRQVFYELADRGSGGRKTRFGEDDRHYVIAEYTARYPNDAPAASNTWIFFTTEPGVVAATLLPTPMPVGKPTTPSSLTIMRSASLIAS